MNLKEKCREVIFSKHAIQQMFNHSITKNNIIFSLEKAEIIVEYKDDKPFPCYLILNYIDNVPLHFLVAADFENNKCIIITAYIPDPDVWENDFKTKRKPK